MMKSIVVVLALFVAAVFAQSCLPAEYANNVWGIPPVLTSPVDIPVGAFCNKNGKGPIQSCCDDATLQQYNTFWKNYKAGIDSSVNDFKTAAKGADAEKLVYAAIPESLKEALQSPLAQPLLTSIIDAYKTFLQDGPNNFGNCMNSLQDYYKGLLCGFCSPNWNSMVSVEGGSGTAYVAEFNLSSTTCTKLSSSCSNFITSAYPVFTAIGGIVGVANPSFNFSAVFPCQSSDCPAFTCNLVQGMSIPNGNINFTEIAFLGLPSVPTTAGAATSARQIFYENAMAMTRSPFNVKKWFQNQQIATRQSSSATVTQANNYNSNGYDAFAAGANANFASTGGSSAFTVLPSIFAGLAALLFTLF